MEIKLAKAWVWATIDGNGSVWLWEKHPYFDKEDETWELDDGGAFERVNAFLSITFGEDIKDAKDKIWKRNGDDWEYAGGQVSKELGIGCLFDNMEAVFDFLGFDLLSYAIAPEEESTCNWNFFVKQSNDTFRCDIALKAIKLVQLIKDAEGTGE